MNIDRYKTLISNLPVRQQSFTTKRATWRKAEKEIDWLENLNNKLFGDKDTLSISRQDIFDTVEIRELILKTIYWGYTGGMRGNHFRSILTKIDLLEKTLTNLKNKTNPSLVDFNELREIFENVPGLGLSTYSKILYFLQIRFNNNPCLILDQRLIDVFARKTYSEFQTLFGISYNNAEKKYLDFLQLANKISKDIQTNGENIEQFLFIFGSNLRTNGN